MICNDFLKLDLPLTWEYLGAIATALAVIVALFANHNSNKQLQKTLQMHEQTKNIDLFEKRTSLINEIQENNKTSTLLLELLFNKSITDEYNFMLEAYNAYLKAKHDLDVYFKIIKEPDGEGGYITPRNEIQAAEQELKRLGYPSDKVSEFELLCKKYEKVYSETGESERLYNYKELSKNIELTSHQFEEEKEKLLDLMKNFIADSISAIDMKKGGRK